MRLDKGPYTASLFIWNGVSAFFLSSNLTPFHSHNTMQVAFDLRSNFRCRTPATDWGIYKSIVIKENAVHQLDTNGSVQLLLYIDAESVAAKAINKKYLKGADTAPLDIDILDIIKPGSLEQCLVEPEPVLFGEVVQRLLDHLSGRPSLYQQDKRITAILKILATNKEEDPSISSLARTVFLSESRLRSLFKKTTGVSLHRYIIWNRIMTGITQLLNGATVADAAASCGFSDTSHFHKMLVQMFGISPSQFIKDNSKKNIHICHADPLLHETRAHNEDTWEITQVYRV